MRYQSECIIFVRSARNGMARDVDSLDSCLHMLCPEGRIDMSNGLMSIRRSSSQAAVGDRVGQNVMMSQVLDSLVAWGQHGFCDSVSNIANHKHSQDLTKKRILFLKGEPLSSQLLMLWISRLRASVGKIWKNRFCSGCPGVMVSLKFPREISHGDPSGWSTAEARSALLRAQAVLTPGLMERHFRFRIMRPSKQKACYPATLPLQWDNVGQCTLELVLL